MDIFEQHEKFEIEVLDKLHRAKLLEPLVFGGGTMLRLCHELKRYSADIDFWFIKRVEPSSYFSKMKQQLNKDYEITDAQIKHYTFLLELRSKKYPKRLKIEIRRAHKEADYQEKIAFSRFTNLQVILKAHTLEQTMKNKVEALLDRAEIRDCFDIEFLLRRGIELPPLDDLLLEQFKSRINSFKKTDFKVKLGSILEAGIRQYYISEGFSYLKEKINEQVSAKART